MHLKGLFTISTVATLSILSIRPKVHGKYPFLLLIDWKALEIVISKVFTLVLIKHMTYVMIQDIFSKICELGRPQCYPDVIKILPYLTVLKF